MKNWTGIIEWQNKMLNAESKATKYFSSIKNNSTCLLQHCKNKDTILLADNKIIMFRAKESMMERPFTCNLRFKIFQEKNVSDRGPLTYQNQGKEFCCY